MRGDGDQMMWKWSVDQDNGPPPGATNVPFRFDQRCQHPPHLPMGVQRVGHGNGLFFRANVNDLVGTAGIGI